MRCPELDRRRRTTDDMSNDTSPIRTRRQALAVAGALTLTVITGGAALLGLAHKPAAPAATPTAAVVQPATSAPVSFEGADD